MSQSAFGLPSGNSSQRERVGDSFSVLDEYPLLKY